MNTFPYISNKRLFSILALLIVALLGVSVIAAKAYGDTPPVYRWFGVKPGSVQVAMIAKMGYCEFYRIKEDGKTDVYAAVSTHQDQSCAVSAR